MNRDLDLPHYNEARMSQRTADVLAVMAGIALMVIALLLSGCSTWGDYAAEVRTVNAQIAADRKAQADRDAKDEASYMSAMGSAQSDVARVAMAGFWALSKAKGGSITQGPGYITPTPPPDHLESAAKILAITLPTVGAAYAAKVGADVAMRQSDNSARVAVSTNDAMVQLGSQGAGVATTALIQLPNLRPSITNTISGNGVIGRGTYSTTTTTSTLTTGGDGVLGPGSITRPANPTRVCSVDATGVLSCAP